MTTHPTTQETPLFGQLVVPGTHSSALPLQKTAVSAQITGPITVVSVTQFFINPLENPVELEYLFPLPHKAALVEFEIAVGSRILHGDLQEIKKAQQTYQEARQEGRQTSLLEQRRPNLFAIKIANVRPGEQLRSILRYQDRLEFDNGQYEFIFPMGITPKYHTADNQEDRQGVDAPLASIEEPVGHIELLVSIDAGFPVSEPSSPSHDLTTTRLDSHRFLVQLKENAIPDHDFILRYSLVEAQAGFAGWRAEGENGEYFLATIVPPAVDENLFSPPPREFIFVFDRSGSMSGEPIAQARNALQACLRILNPEDTFYILFFDDKIEWFRQQSSHVTQENIDAADQYLSGIAGRGGTEILGALNQALSLPIDPEKRARYIIFLTDGAVSAEERMLEKIRRQLNNERIFTFGIGPSVNRALLSELARLGHGMAEYLQLDEDIEGAIMRFQDRVSFPLLTDIVIQYENCKTWDVFPSRIPDLFNGQPIEITGRMKLTGKKQPILNIKAQLQNSSIDWQLNLTNTSSDPAIKRAWARTRLDELLEQYANQREGNKIRDEIISLALEYQMVTPFTAFVALDSDLAIQPGADIMFIQIAQPLPKGLDINGFTGGSGAVLRMMAPPPPSSLSAMPMSKASIPSTPRPTMHLADRSKSKDDYVDSREINASTELVRPLEAVETLRLLARTQNLNGSWNNDLETTAAAFLAFIRQGNTPQKGLYRRHLRKAFDWLLACSATSRFASFVRALAFHELAKKNNTSEAKQAAQISRGQLPLPASLLETTVLQLLDASPVAPDQIKSNTALDAFRFAGLLRILSNETKSQLSQNPDLLAQIWLACI